EITTDKGATILKSIGEKGPLHLQPVHQAYPVESLKENLECKPFPFYFTAIFVDQISGQSHASSLIDQVRSNAKVTTAVARGDLTQKIDIRETINSMVDQLSAFASEVTRVALEVGTEGIFGGQAG
ncbi:hypothetical protein H0H92_010212, partial [Tricholoma furcatifolium]